MTQAERRHDRLAVRLSLIISRLVAGDPVFIQALPHFRFIQQSLLAFVPADSPPE